jgi:hypothetical protein
MVPAALPGLPPVPASPLLVDEDDEVDDDEVDDDEVDDDEEDDDDEVDDDDSAPEDVVEDALLVVPPPLDDEVASPWPPEQAAAVREPRRGMRWRVRMRARIRR